VRAAGSSHSDDGFTLIETLAGLLILAISSGLLIQSISGASAQIRSARSLIAAEETALFVLAAHSSGAKWPETDEGVDPASDFFWRYSEKTTARNASDPTLTDIKLIEIEVRPTRDAPVIYRLKTLVQKQPAP
jgi:prepilin-type N-terminal cleavage/methylation domain-containing protein